MKLLKLLEDENGEEEYPMREQAMAAKLHQAAMTGSLSSLSQLLLQDPQILSKPPPTSSLSDTPLHVAAFLGYLHFAAELLRHNPDLADALNSRGSAPLHVAAAKGYAEMAKDLVLAKPDVCFVLDHDGRSPLHLAAIKGRVGVLTELVRVKPEAAWVLTAGGETCLHLCVKYNRLEALKLLVDGVEKDGFLNWKDGDGNTILHLAASRKQLEIIRFLLGETTIEVNARNANGLTALDVLAQSPRDLRDMEIKEYLLGRAAIRVNSMPPLHIGNGDTAMVSSVTEPEDLQEDGSTKEQPKKHKHTDWLARKRSAVMVVASLIATVAFQAAISPPGGVWQNDSLKDSNGNPVEDPHEVGQSVMAFTIPEAFGQFMIFDTIAFLASLSIILLQISGLPMKRRRWMWSQMITMWIAITAQTITYFIAIIQMTPKNIRAAFGTLYQVTKIAVLTWLTIISIVLIGNGVRAIYWLRREYGYMVKEILQEHPVGEILKKIVVTFILFGKRFKSRNWRL